MKTTGHSQRRGLRRRATVAALLVAAAPALVATAPSTSSAGDGTAGDRTPAAPPTPRDTAVRVHTFEYTAHDGSRLRAFVVLPASYERSSDAPIPLVISPHGRNGTAESMLRRFGNLPAIGSFALVSPETQGRRTELYAWGYPRTIDDLARMPDLVAKALPWLRIDQSRIYAFGTSMGGQEALLLGARYPQLLAGVAAFDSTVDFARQYRNFPKIANGKALQRLARNEAGGTPVTAKRAYAERSPITYARQLALSDVALQLWWTPRDTVVIEPQRQSGALLAKLKKVNPAMPVVAFTGTWHHAKSMRASHVLPMALARFGLLPREFKNAPSRFHVVAVRMPQ